MARGFGLATRGARRAAPPRPARSPRRSLGERPRPARPDPADRDRVPSARCRGRGSRSRRRSPMYLPRRGPRPRRPRHRRAPARRTVRWKPSKGGRCHKRPPDRPGKQPNSSERSSTRRERRSEPPELSRDRRAERLEKSGREIPRGRMGWMTLRGVPGGPATARALQRCRSGEEESAGSFSGRRPAARASAGDFQSARRSFGMGGLKRHCGLMTGWAGACAFRSGIRARTRTRTKTRKRTRRVGGRRKTEDGRRGMKDVRQPVRSRS